MKKYIFFTLLIAISVVSLFAPKNFVLADKTNQEIDKLQAEIDEKDSLVTDLNEKINVYKKNIQDKQGDQITLLNQIEIIEQDINKTKTEITKTETEISKLTSQIKLTTTKIDETQEDISIKQDQVSSYILNIYTLEQKTNLEILLTNNTFSDYYSHVEYSKKLQEEFQKSLNQLQTLKEKLKTQKEELDTNKKQQTTKKKTLSVQENSLKGESITKNIILEEAEEDEEKFQELVKKVKQEQSTINSQIATLENQMRTKIDNNSTNTDDTNNSTDNSDFTMPENFQPIWPVDSRRITATFYDPSYPFKNWFEHTAIDIGTAQGSPIYAADGGVVAIAKNDGTTAYSYIMIIHADGFATIYGHTSAVYVQPDQQVNQGEVIGLTGGMPGTTGAGYYTTGPHIHFGVRLNGIAVNPLNYLP